MNGTRPAAADWRYTTKCLRCLHEIPPRRWHLISPLTAKTWYRWARCSRCGRHAIREMK